MRPPIFVHSLRDDERTQVAAGLRSSDAFTFRRRLILLASARGERAPRIARALACDEQTVRDAIHAFNAAGLAALHPQSRRPRTRPQAAFTAERLDHPPRFAARTKKAGATIRSAWPPLIRPRRRARPMRAGGPARARSISIFPKKLLITRPWCLPGIAAR